jgi:phosphoribosylformylglycinamidine cyclo-ligase
VIDQSWTVPPIFAWLARTGGVAVGEMLRVFNCGIGMVVVTAEPDAAEARLRANGETVFRIGRIEAGQGEATTRITPPRIWPGG